VGIGVSWLLSNFSKATTNELAHIADINNTHLVNIRHDLLRLFMYLERQNEDDGYRFWHFKWRFETFDTFDIKIIDNNDNSKKYLTQIKVLGQNYSAKKMGLESTTDCETYLVKVSNNYLKINKEKKLFDNDDRLACSFIHDKPMISKGSNLYDTDHDTYEFMIIALGASHVRAVNPLLLAADDDPLPRLKDLYADTIEKLNQANIEASFKEKIKVKYKKIVSYLSNTKTVMKEKLKTKYKGIVCKLPKLKLPWKKH